MVTTTRRITVEELERDGPPEGRWELINGELVEMPAAGASHGRISGKIHGYVFIHITPDNLGFVYRSETGFVLPGDPPALRLPDVGYVRMERLPADHNDGGFLRAAPDFAVEVISLYDRMVDVLAKVLVWLEAGVTLVWLVDPTAETVTVFRGDRAPRRSPLTRRWTAKMSCLDSRCRCAMSSPSEVQWHCHPIGGNRIDLVEIRAV